MKSNLKKQIRHILTGKTDPEAITGVIIINEQTGDKIFVGNPPKLRDIKK
jgi:hypothetical protein